MRRALSLSLTAMLLFAVGCRETGPSGSSATTGPEAVISDGATGTSAGTGADGQANSHFFWLPPLVPEPDSSLLGTFDPTLHPTVRIMCEASTDPAVTDCDGSRVIATFDVGSGLTVGTDHYQAELDTKAVDPPLATSSGDTTTTYRIEVLTPPFGDALGGPYVFGVADFQLGASGQDARNVETGSMIGLKDGRTLPIKFRLDREAQGEELKQNGVLAGLVDGALCQSDCSATVLEPDDTTEASLYDSNGTELTALLAPPGAVDEPTVLIIDRRDAGPNGDCAPGATLVKDACYRYVLSPDLGDAFTSPPTYDFNVPVRYGICPDPDGPDVSGGVLDPRWRLLKADVENQQTLVTRPEQVDVSDFLTCEVGPNEPVALWHGPLGRLAGKMLHWLVRPARASHLLGGRLEDLSDLFWGLDAELHPVGPTAFGPAAAGDTVRPTVRVVAVHDSFSASPGVERDTVTFTVTGGGGTLGSGQQSSVDVTTDTAGVATVAWLPTGSGDTLTARAHHALVYDSAGVGRAAPVTFTASPSSLTGSWSGTYAWNCGSGLTGSSLITLELAQSGSSLSGTARYLGDSTSVSGDSYSTLQAADIGPDPWNVRLDWAATSSFVLNTFEGVRVGADSLSGYVLNGDSPQSQSQPGCSALTGPSGRIAVSRVVP